MPKPEIPSNLTEPQPASELTDMSNLMSGSINDNGKDGDVARDAAPGGVGAVREAIASAYCRSMAVIDDQIFIGKAMEDRFFELQEESQAHSILCSFLHYKVKDCEAEAELVAQAVQIARCADVVVLDWSMGNPDGHLEGGGGDRGDCSHAISIIRQLVSDGGIRFVVIYTREGLGSVEDELKEAFSLELLPGSGAVAEESEFVTGLATTGVASSLSQEKIFHVNNQLFIATKRVGLNARLSARELIELIPTILLRAFPDFLHWAGLEVAVRARDILPEVLAVLPRNTDGPMMHQLLYQMRHGEMSDFVSGILLSELEYRFHLRPLESIADDVLFARLRDAMKGLGRDKERLKKLVEKLTPAWRETMLKLKKAEADAVGLTTVMKAGKQLAAAIDELSWEAVTLESARKAASIGASKTAMSNYFPYILLKAESANPDGCEASAEYIEDALMLENTASDFQSWASMAESVRSSLPSDGMWPGYVLRLIRNLPGKRKWLLCITPACDCYRPGGSGYLFVGGSAARVVRPGRSLPRQTQSSIGDYQIIWDATNLVVEKDPLGVSGTGKSPAYEVYGALRQPFTDRIIQRIWSYQSRVGVDSSERFRNLRGE